MELRKQVEQSNRAKSAEEFVKLVIEDAKKYALNALLDKDSDICQVRADYKAAIALYQRVQSIIVAGAIAQETLIKLESEED